VFASSDVIAGVDVIDCAVVIAGIGDIAGVGVVDILIGVPDIMPPTFAGIVDSSARPSSDSTERDVVRLDRRAPASRSVLV
jgi:hypothetical protein